ncbi:MAG: acyltransferase family protein [Myxococcota bacterium]
MTEAGDGGGAGRIVAIDVIKATAIVAVAFTHAGFPSWDPRFTTWDRLLTGFWVQFHVPAFLMISGFLYQSSSAVPLLTVGRRLMRVLVPYLIASAVVQLGGFSTAKDFRDVVLQLLTASSLGIYYFIFLLVSFIPTIWPLSRLSSKATWVVFLGVLGATLGLEVYIQLRMHPDPDASLKVLFWVMRSPLNYSYAYFLAGWVAAQHYPGLRGFPMVRWRLLGSLCVLGIMLWTAAHIWPEIWIAAGIVRFVYTMSVVVGLILLSDRASEHRLVRFLSETTLGLYLYHHIFQLLAERHVLSWPPLFRITVLALGGLGAASLLCSLGRRLLGSRAKTLLGA